MPGILNMGGSLVKVKVKINPEVLESVRERATRMWIDETHPSRVPRDSVNVFYILKAFCETQDIDVDLDVTRKNTGAIDDIN